MSTMPIRTFKSLDAIRDDELRDRFARSALRGLIACWGLPRAGDDAKLACRAYQVAEAMMAERARRMEGQ